MQLVVERAQRFRDREQRLQDLAVEYVIADEEIGSVRESVDGEVAEVLAQAERAAARLRDAADAKVQEHEGAKAAAVVAMLSEGEAVADVAVRLGIPASAVRRYKQANDAQEPASAPHREPEESGGGPAAPSDPTEGEPVSSGPSLGRHEVADGGSV